MTTGKAKIKPYEVDFLQYSGENLNEIKEFIGEKSCIGGKSTPLKVQTADGLVILNEGEYLLRGPGGDFITCTYKKFLNSFIVTAPAFDIY